MVNEQGKIVKTMRNAFHPHGQPPSLYALNKSVADRRGMGGSG